MRSITWKWVDFKCEKVTTNEWKFQRNENCNIARHLAFSMCFFSDLFHQSELGLWEVAACQFHSATNSVWKPGTYLVPLVQIGECVAIWWRPNFETIMYPYCPPHITKPKVNDYQKDKSWAIVYVVSIIGLHMISPSLSFPRTDFFTDTKLFYLPSFGNAGV